MLSRPMGAAGTSREFGEDSRGLGTEQHERPAARFGEWIADSVFVNYVSRCSTGEPVTPTQPKASPPATSVFSGERESLARQAQQAARQNYRRHHRFLSSTEYATEVILQRSTACAIPTGRLIFGVPVLTVSVRACDLRRLVECAGRAARYSRNCYASREFDPGHRRILGREGPESCQSGRRRVDTDDPLFISPVESAREPRA